MPFSCEQHHSSFLSIFLATAADRLRSTPLSVSHKGFLKRRSSLVQLCSTLFSLFNKQLDQFSLWLHLRLHPHTEEPVGRMLTLEVFCIYPLHNFRFFFRSFDLSHIFCKKRM